VTTQATARSVRSADGTSIGFSRVGTGPAVVLVDAAGASAASALWGRWPLHWGRSSRSLRTTAAAAVRVPIRRRTRWSARSRTCRR
jgi:hypothetical protein